MLFWLTLLWLLFTPLQTFTESSRLPFATKPRDKSFGNSSQAELQVPFTQQQRNTTLTSAAVLVKKQWAAKYLTWCQFLNFFSASVKVRGEVLETVFHAQTQMVLPSCRNISNVECGSNLVSAGTSPPQPVATGSTGWGLLGSILTPKQ